MSKTRRGAVVEIIDPSSKDDFGVMTPSIVRVNGVDVGLIAADGVVVSAGGHSDITTVTITLMPSEVHVVREHQPRHMAPA